MRKRITSAMLALCLLLAMLPAPAQAAPVPPANIPVVIETIEDLAAALTPEGFEQDEWLTVNAGTITLNMSSHTLHPIELTAPLRIRCNAFIDLNGVSINAGDNYIQVDSGCEVHIMSPQNWGHQVKIESTNETAAVVAQRGSKLTLHDVEIWAEHGYGIMLSPESEDGTLKTELTLANVHICPNQVGIYVDGSIQDPDEENWPVLNINNSMINVGASEGCGLYLAGAAKTTMSGGSISAPTGIVIKAGTLDIGSYTLISGTGEYTEDPGASGNEINSDGSAILIENHPDYAGNIKIDIQINSSVVSEHGYAIREVTDEEWEGIDPEIAIDTEILYGRDFGPWPDVAIKVDNAKLSASDNFHVVLPMEEPNIAPRGEPIYQEAYEEAGLMLSGPESDPNVGYAAYTLTIDELKLGAIDDNIRGTLSQEGHEDALWFGVEIKAPERFKDEVKGAKWEYDDGDESFPMAEVTLNNNEKSFYHYVKVSDHNGICLEERVGLIAWLNEQGRAVTWYVLKINCDLKEACSVTFNSRGGSVVKPGTVLVSEGERVERPADPTMPGHVFGGWYRDRALATPWDFEKDRVETNPRTNNNLTLYAKWDPVWTVTLNGSEGEPETQTLTTGKDGKLKKADLDRVKAPTRANHTFKGWFTQATGGDQFENLNDTYVFTDDVILYAQWTADASSESSVRTVTLDGNGGEPETQTLTTDGKGLLKKADLARVKAPTRANHTFKGWFTQATGGDQFENLNDTYVFTDDVTFYAQWTADASTEPSAYTITFNGTGGEPGTQTLTTNAEGKLESLPSEPTRANYTFKGWYTAITGGTQVDTSTVFSEDTTVYAQWDRNGGSSTPGSSGSAQTYTITFNPNGGTVSPATAATNNDGTVTLPTPTRTGYTFAGWYTAVSGGTLVTASTVFSADTTLYARWSQGSGTPASGAYQIYAPGSVYGGSFSLSHSSADAGTVVTIILSPSSGYTLGQISVTRVDTSQALYLSRYGNQYTFTMPASDVRLSIAFTTSYAGSGNSGQSRYVDWYYSNGNIYHVSSGLVSTGSSLTRDMLVSIFYNMDADRSGTPATWAASNDIVPDIIMSELWGTDKSISREQAAMILYCYARYKGYDISWTSDFAGYSDRDQIRAIARPAMAWCHATGIMSGTSATTISPRDILTCGQAVTLLSRFISIVTGMR